MYACSYLFFFSLFSFISCSVCSCSVSVWYWMDLSCLTSVCLSVFMQIDGEQKEVLIGLLVCGTCKWLALSWQWRQLIRSQDGNRLPLVFKTHTCHALGFNLSDQLAVLIFCIANNINCMEFAGRTASSDNLVFCSSCNLTFLILSYLLFIFFAVPS